MNLFCFSLVRPFDSLSVSQKHLQPASSFECDPCCCVWFAFSPAGFGSVPLPRSLLPFPDKSQHSAVHICCCRVCVSKNHSGEQRESVDEHQGHRWSLSSCCCWQEARGSLCRQMLDVNNRDLFEPTSCHELLVGRDGSWWGGTAPGGEGRILVGRDGAEVAADSLRIVKTGRRGWQTADSARLRQTPM